MLTTPRFIQQSIASAELLFHWDEWRVKDYYADFSDEDFGRLAALSGRANAALAYASAEWVLHRFSTVNSDQNPRHYLDACWAANVHPTYFPYTVLDDDEWRGPVRSPLRMMMAIAGDAYFAIDDDPDLQSRALWMRNLARHLLPEVEVYNGWFEGCVERLMEHHTQEQRRTPADDDLFSELPEGMGTPVPRELFDLERVYDPGEDVELVDAYLCLLKPKENPFLADLEDLEEVEGIGSPFRYSISSQLPTSD